MMSKSKLSILFIFLAYLGCARVFADNTNSAQLKYELTELVVGEVPEDLKELDGNAEPLGVVKFLSDLSGLKFSNNVMHVKEEPLSKTNKHVYIVKVLNGTNKLRVSHDEYLPIEVLFDEPIEGDRLYEGFSIIGFLPEKVETAQISKQDFTCPLKINTEYFPSIYIDEEYVGNGEMTVNVEEGEHFIKSSYDDVSYQQKIDVKKPLQEVDMNLGHTVIIKSAKDEPKFIYNGITPNPKLADSGRNNYSFTGLLGDYTVVGQASGAGFGKDVEKKLTLGMRGRTTMHFDEMVGYTFFFYQGTHIQPLGFNLAYCRKFGWFFSYTTNIKTSINTSEGKMEFDKVGVEKDKWSTRVTSQTFLTGPMFKLYRRFYMQVGGGIAVYLRTAEPKVLTVYDFKNVIGGAAAVNVVYRISHFSLGVGYCRQFVKSAYNPKIANQFAFSIGYAM